MQVYDIIEQAQAGHAMANLARTFDITEQQARLATETILPELAWNLERNTLSRGGLADLLQALGQGHHELILETPRAWSDPRVAADGTAILGHILRSPRKTQALVAQAAKAAGLSEGIVEMLLPILAQLLMGAIARYAKGGLGDILSRLPIPGGGTGGGSTQPRAPSGNSPGSGLPGGTGFELPRSELPPAGGFPMPPMPPSSDEAPSRGGGLEMPWPGSGTQRRPEPGAGEPDFRTGGRMGQPQPDLPPVGGYPMPPIPPWPDGSHSPDARGNAPPENGRLPFPLPGPGDGNPYDDLSDILRRGGRASGSSTGGGLWRSARNVLDGVLGFGGRGVFGWLIRLIVLRWGWRFLQRLLSRLLLGR